MYISVNETTSIPVREIIGCSCSVLLGHNKPYMQSMLLFFYFFRRGLGPELLFHQLGHTWNTHWYPKMRQTAFCENCLCLHKIKIKGYSRSVRILCRESLAQSLNVLVSDFNISHHAAVRFYTPLLCSAVSYILLENDVIFTAVSANAFEFIVGFVLLFLVDCSIFSLSSRP